MNKWVRSLLSLPLRSRFVSPSVSSRSSPTFVSAFASSNMSSSDAVKLSDEEWKQRLTPMQFQVLRLKGTERAGTGEYNKHKETGVYVCAGCKTALYTSTTKFDSGCGWPAFYDAIPSAIKAVPDADGHRTEIMCAKCDGHMGHVFKGEGFKTPTDERHCVNSVSLVFHAGEIPPQ
ncbi:methionine-R-sulfoxide reductase [Phytophthora nicotianae INRA-310]|uniref:Peptide-methionine (R)-S-oxide reductase n=2 Tax=Phytophthora nicotianae (strain INRA-310) TaxID=761204 RepID=W2R952_PHYN3|nr:methionine-R-sulfoxide reductase [Phytophthora nicotianae INRA-310]ETN21239.1 methionine-R-sulfoxide reductase [Phytophthora nicotianae INRA-310]